MKVSEQQRRGVLYRDRRRAMRVTRRANEKRKEERAEWLDRGAETGATERDINQMPRMVVVGKLNWVKQKLKKIEGDRYSLIVGLQLTQKELKWVEAELNQITVLIESLRKSAIAKNRSRGGQRRVPRGVMQRPRYKICVQGCLYGFVLAAHSQVLEFAEMKKPELCFS